MRLNRNKMSFKPIKCLLGLSFFVFFQIRNFNSDDMIPCSAEPACREMVVHGSTWTSEIEEDKNPVS